MPRFYFDLSFDNDTWSEDPDGSELGSMEEVRVEALELAAEIAKEQVKAHRLVAVRVRDRGPDPVLVVTLSVELQPPD